MGSIHSWIHRKLVVLDRTESAQTAARAMRAAGTGCVLVGDGQGHLVGILTDRDFACRWAADFGTSEIPISRIMTSEVITASENASLDQIIGLMENHGVRRIPIVAHEGPKAPVKAVGIVTLDDLIMAGMVAPGQLAQIVRRQIGMRVGLLSQRSEARTHQALDRFYSSVSRSTGLSTERVPAISHLILGSLVLRITATAAAHFIAQLPKLLQGPLLQLPSGPDRGITVGWIIDEIASRQRMSQESAQNVLKGFFASLRELVTEGDLKHLRAQLPEEFYAYLQEPQQKAPAA